MLKEALSAKVLKLRKSTQILCHLTNIENIPKNTLRRNL